MAFSILSSKHSLNHPDTHSVDTKSTVAKYSSFSEDTQKHKVFSSVFKGSNTGTNEDNCSCANKVTTESSRKNKKKDNDNGEIEPKFPKLLRRCSDGILNGCDICLFG